MAAKRTIGQRARLSREHVSSRKTIRAAISALSIPNHRNSDLHEDEIADLHEPEQVAGPPK